MYDISDEYFFACVKFLNEFEDTYGHFDTWAEEKDFYAMIDNGEEL